MAPGNCPPALVIESALSESRRMAVRLRAMVSTTAVLAESAAALELTASELEPEPQPDNVVRVRARPKPDNSTLRGDVYRTESRKMKRETVGKLHFYSLDCRGA